MRDLDNSIASLSASVTNASGLAKASAYLKIGDAFMTKKCFAQAISSYQAALKIRTEFLGEGSLKVANVMHCIGVALLKSSLPERLSGEGSQSTLADEATKKEQQDALQQAGQWLERALNVRRRKLSASHIDIAESEHYLGLALAHANDRLNEALELLHSAFRVRCAVLGQNNCLVAETLEGLGVAYLWSENQRRATQAFAFALSVRESVHGDNSIEVGACRLALAQAYTTSGDHDMALQHTTRAVAILKARFGLDDHRTADGWLRLGLCHFARGDLRSAVKSALRAVRIFSSSDLSKDVRAARLREAWTILAEARWEMQEYELAVIAAQVLADGVVDQQGVNTAPGEDQARTTQLISSDRGPSAQLGTDLLSLRAATTPDNLGNLRGRNMNTNSLASRDSTGTASGGDWHRLNHQGTSSGEHYTDWHRLNLQENSSGEHWTGRYEEHLHPQMFHQMWLAEQSQVLVEKNKRCLKAKQKTKDGKTREDSTPSEIFYHSTKQEWILLEEVLLLLQLLGILRLALACDLRQVVPPLKFRAFELGKCFRPGREVAAAAFL